MPSTGRGRLKKFFPILGWLPRYDKKSLRPDCVAALSVWALLVPQSLAYSSIAGVPVQYGLYAAFAGLVAYAVFGTSRQLVQGPSAAVAAVSAAVILPIVGAAAMGTDDAVPTTAALAIVTGVLYLCLGVGRMGWVSSFLSKAVMSGFVLGFSIGIIIDQSYKLFGVPSVEGSYWDKLVGTIRELPDTNRTTFILGATALAVLLAMRRWAPKLPRALIVVAVSTALVTALDLATDGVAVTGAVPTGLFSIDFPWGNFQEQGALIVGALSIIFVGYSETLASGRAMATKHAYRIDADQELIAEGFAAVGAGLMGAYATDGSLSKTSVADAAGQRTQMASLVNAVLILLTMLVLASLFENLASAVLGAVVIDAMVGLITFVDFRRYARVNRADCAAFLASGLGILFFSIIAGIAIGVVLSLLMLVARASRPTMRRLGRDPETNAYRDAERNDEVELDSDVVVLRLDGPLFFANAERFRDGVVDTLTEVVPRPSAIVVDMEGVSYTDTDGADSLTTLAVEVARQDVWFGVARAESAVRDLWDRAGAMDAVGATHYFPDVDSAVRAAIAATRDEETDPTSNA